MNKIREIRNNRERQIRFAIEMENRLLIFHSGVTFVWAVKARAVCCLRNAKVG
jgi:hypothetical protein